MTAIDYAMGIIWTAALLLAWRRFHADNAREAAKFRAEIARLRYELAKATAVETAPDSNAEYDAIRCRTCGRSWDDHDEAGCYMKPPKREDLKP